MYIDIYIYIGYVSRDKYMGMLVGSISRGKITLLTSPMYVV